MNCSAVQVHCSARNRQPETHSTTGAVAIRLDSFIDPALIRRVEGIIRGMFSEKGYEFARVTHSISEAMFLAERTIMLSRRPARIVVDRAVELRVECDTGIR